MKYSAFGIVVNDWQVQPTQWPTGGESGVRVKVSDPGFSAELFICCQLEAIQCLIEAGVHRPTLVSSDYGDALQMVGLDPEGIADPMVCFEAARRWAMLEARA